MDPHTFLQLIGALLAQENARSSKPKDSTTQANNQATFLSKLVNQLGDPTFMALMGQAPSTQSQPISTPLVDSYMNGKNETLRTAVQGLVSGQYSPQDAVALIMEDKTLSSYYNPASGGDISYWNSQMKSVMDELSKAQQDSAKAAAEDPYAKLGLQNPSLRYGAVTDRQAGTVQVPADTSYYDSIINRDAANFSAPGPMDGQGLSGPTNSAGSTMRKSGTVKGQALQFDGSPRGATVKSVAAPATWDAQSVALARDMFLNKQAAQANAAGRTPHGDSAAQLLAALTKMYGVG